MRKKCSQGAEKLPRGAKEENHDSVRYERGQML